MKEDLHELAQFTDAVVAGAGYNDNKWDVDNRDESEYACDPTYDRRIIYSTEHAEARIRERRSGALEIVVFIWSDTNEKGTRVIRQFIPELETFAQRKAYLKRVARYVEKLNTKMSAVDDCIEKMSDDIW